LRTDKLPDYQKRLPIALKRHGYEFEAQTNQWKAIPGEKAKVTFHQVVIWAVEEELNQLVSRSETYLMDVGNAMRSARIRPNAEAMAAYCKVWPEEEEQWNNLEEMWREEELCNQITVRDETNKDEWQPSNQFQKILRDIFAMYAWREWLSIED